jgi:hypothetical protein
LIQDELDDVLQVWNAHHIRSSRNANVAHGKPNAMMSAPELFNTRSYLQTVQTAQLDIHRAVVSMHVNTPCNEDLFEWCCTVLENHGLVLSTVADDVTGVCKRLRSEIRNLIHYMLLVLVLHDTLPIVQKKQIKIYLAIRKITTFQTNII